MNVSTLFKRAAFVAVLGVGALSMNAQFLYEGVIYKAGTGKKNTELTVQKPTTKVGGAAVLTEYAGDITVPSTLTYEGKEYTVVSIAAAFKAQPNLTSITLGDGITTFSRGAFQDCKNLVKANIPKGLSKWVGDIFNGCEKLESITIPAISGELTSNQFTGCTGLKKIIFEDGATPLDMNEKAFGDVVPEIEEVVLNRAIGTKYTTMTNKIFRNLKSLKKVTIGGSCTEIPASYFEGASALSQVVFENEVTSFGTNAFAGTALTEFTVPATITEISSSLFQGCKSLTKVVLPEGLTTISPMAFYNSTVADVNLPSTLTSIGQMAFSGSKIAGKLEFPAAVRTVGIQAYANTPLTEVVFPASVKTIGDGVFMGATGIAKFTVAADNEAYATADNGAVLATKDGATVVAVAPASALTALTGNYTAIAPYAAYKAAKVTEVSLPACADWGDYAVSETGIKDLSVKGTVGRYVAANCAALKSLTIDGKEAPFGIAKNCTALDQVTFVKDINIVKQEAFAGATALKGLDLGKMLVILEADCFKGSGITELTVGAAVPAGQADGVFTEGCGITVRVPADYANVYKAASGWSYCTIVGDANVAVGPTNMGMPSGLYYAGEDGNLHVVYADGQSDTYDVGGAPHTFQLAQFKNRIYGASAGNKFVYSATGATDGDGKLYYISKLDQDLFQAVVLDNAGNNAYKDPFGLYIYDETLYVNDRNVCIRKIPAEALSLPQDYPSWMENNWMGYYNVEWVYGCIKCGWAITTDPADNMPQYWVGMKYNGNGIYRFKDEHIGDATTPGKKPEKGAFLTTCAPIFTTFYIDEAHGHLYMYNEKTGSGDKLLKGGVYRFNLADLEANPNPSNINDLNPVLIDGAPVKYEGSATNEHVGISQFNPDENGEYLYWCYRAPSAEEAATNEAQDEATMLNGKYWWADKYDANNPLHQSGIKRIKLGEANPTVEMVAPGVKGYGIVPVNYEGSTKPTVDGVNNVITEAAEAALTVNGDILTAEADAVVNVYDMTGTIVAYGQLAAGESMSIAHLGAGAYIATANGAILKFVK